MLPTPRGLADNPRPNSNGKVLSSSGVSSALQYPPSTLDTVSLHDWPFVEVAATSQTYNSYYRVRGAPYGPAHQSRHVHCHQLLVPVFKFLTSWVPDKVKSLGNYLLTEGVLSGVAILCVVHVMSFWSQSSKCQQDIKGRGVNCVSGSL